MEKFNTEGFEEFGDLAELAATLFERAHVPMEGISEAPDLMMIFILKESFSPAQLDCLLGMLSEKEIAAEAAAVAAEREARRGCIGQLFPWLMGHQPKAPADTHRPDYAAVRVIIKAAKQQQESEAFKKVIDDAFAEYDAKVAALRRWQAEQN